METNHVEKKKRIVTSVTFDPETITYIDEVRKKEERTRSAMIRALIREHMRAHNAQPVTTGS